MIKSIKPYSSTKDTLREDVCLRFIKPTTQAYLGNVGLLTISSPSLVRGEPMLNPTTITLVFNQLNPGLRFTRGRLLVAKQQQLYFYSTSLSFKLFLIFLFHNFILFLILPSLYMNFSP
jgi:hypothetical protein